MTFQSPDEASWAFCVFGTSHLHVPSKSTPLSLATLTLATLLPNQTLKKTGRNAPSDLGSPSLAQSPLSLLCLFWPPSPHFYSTSPYSNHLNYVFLSPLFPFTLSWFVGISQPTGPFSPFKILDDAVIFPDFSMWTTNIEPHNTRWRKLRCMEDRINTMVDISKPWSLP